MSRLLRFRIHIANSYKKMILPDTGTDKVYTVQIQIVHVDVD
jgi:hypothetical protein